MACDGYALLKRELQSGERLLWTGRPRQGVFVTRQKSTVSVLIVIAFLICLGLIILGISRGLYALAFFAALFCLATVQTVLTYLILDPGRRRYLYYGLTDRRAIIANTRGRGTTQSVRISKMSEVALSGRGINSGTIVCLCLSDGWFRRNGRGEIRRLPLFRYIVDARHVYLLFIDMNPALAVSSTAR